MDILSALSESNSILTLGIEIAGELVPIFKGTIAEIKKIGAKTDAVDYQVVLQGDESALATVETMSEADLTAISAEFARLGKPPLPGPPAPEQNPPAA